MTLGSPRNDMVFGVSRLQVEVRVTSTAIRHGFELYECLLVSTTVCSREFVVCGYRWLTWSCRRCLSSGYHSLLYPSSALEWCFEILCCFLLLLYWHWRLRVNVKGCAVRAVQPSAFFCYRWKLLLWFLTCPERLHWLVTNGKGNSRGSWRGNSHWNYSVYVYMCVFYIVLYCIVLLLKEIN